MTLIIGVLCEDGVVICGDGAATSSIREPTEKVTAIGDNLLVGYAGDHALIQQVTDRLQSELTERNLQEMRPDEIKRWLLQTVGDEVEFVVEQMKRYSSTTQKELDSVKIHALLSYYNGSRIQLLKMEHPKISEQARLSTDSSFAIGMGKRHADPFLVHLRAIWFGDRPITIGEAKLLAMVTMQHVIHVSPGGISKPIRMGQMQPGNGKAIIEILDKDDIALHDAMVQDFHDYISEFPKRFQRDIDEAADTPEIPDET